MASWSPPEPTKLQEILQTIRDSIDTQSKGQKAITRKLKRFTRVPGYIAYLAHILAALTQEEAQTRAAAGYLLKSNAEVILKASPKVVEYSKAAVLSAFNDPSALVRTAAGQGIVAFLKALEAGKWPDCLEQLLVTLDDPDRQEVAISVFKHACEDFPRKLDFETSGTRPLKYMISKFLKLSEHPSPKVRSRAVACLSHFVPIKSPSLLKHIDTFLACLFMRASDEDPSVRRYACKSFILLLAAWPEILLPEIASVAELILHALKDKNECGNRSLWILVGSETPELAPFFKPFLGRVAPALLDCLVCSEEDLLQLEGNTEGATAPNEENDDSNDESSMESNLRACATNVLDKLESTEWLQRESAILALGAIAGGCIDCLEESLNALIPFLVETLNDARPLVRSITCWTLGRYAGWCMQPISEDHKNRYFDPMIEGLLQMVLDDNKHVRRAACRAFATLSKEEDVGTKLGPHLQPILRNTVLASQNYQNESMSPWYDAIGALAGAVGGELSQPQYVEILMPSLTIRWNILQDDDKDLIPLLECLSSVASALGPAFAPCVSLTFPRCAKIAHQSVLKFQLYQQNSDLDEPDKSFLVASLNLLSGLVQGLGMSLEHTISSTKRDVDIFILLTSCWMHTQPLVRQSAYVLVGHLASGCFTLLRPYLPALMPALILQLDPIPKAEDLSAQCKLTWSVGEVALQYRRGDLEFRQWVKPLVDRMIPILLHPLAPRELYENAAISTGRISLLHPSLVAPRLPEFADIWCEVFSEIRKKEEADSAFRGFCGLVKPNPALITLNLISFCKAVARWNNPSPELDNMFREILMGFRERTPTVWRALVTSLPPAILEGIATRYGL